MVGQGREVVKNNIVVMKGGLGCIQNQIKMVVDWVMVLEVGLAFSGLREDLLG